jgi:hypothetical protein
MLLSSDKRMAWSSNDLVVYGQCVALIVVYISCVILGRPIGDGRILLVDDSDELREFSTSILQHAGYSVATASNGEEALAKIRMDRPDLVISDVVMPCMDGLGSCSSCEVISRRPCRRLFCARDST